jgi:antitoxin (DNA-binding transcriptional repressor) of toxin-antitoxin stability system
MAKIRWTEEAAIWLEDIIVKAGKAVAKLVPIKRHTVKRKSGVDKGKAWIADDFDAPLPEELQSYFE